MKKNNIIEKELLLKERRVSFWEKWGVLPHIDATIDDLEVGS